MIRKPNKRKAYLAAQDVLNRYYISNLSELNMKDLLGSEGLYYREKSLKSAFAYLQRSEHGGIVTIDPKITNPTRRRFILAHELGHWRMHDDIPVFSCNPDDFKQWKKNIAHYEVEANAFAAELLMPELSFINMCSGSYPTLELLEHAHSKFGAGITSIAIRYCLLEINPCVLIFSQDRRVKWYIKSDNFTYGFYENNFKVPSESITDDAFDGDDVKGVVDEIEARIWFYNERKNLDDKYLCETVIPMPQYNSCLTFLWESENNFSKDGSE